MGANRGLHEGRQWAQKVGIAGRQPEGAQRELLAELDVEHSIGVKTQDS